MNSLMSLNVAGVYAEHRIHGLMSALIAGVFTEQKANNDIILGFADLVEFAFCRVSFFNS